MTRRTLIPLALCVAMLLVAVPVQAGEASGEETLDWLDYIDVTIDNNDGDSLSITYDVEVTEGVAVNVYFVDQQGYDDYVDPLIANFSYFVSYSVLNTKDAEQDWTWNDKGDFYVIIENAGDSSVNTSTVKYKVTWGPAAWWLLGLSFLTCMIIILVAVVFGIVILYMIIQSIKAKGGISDESPEPQTSPASDPPPGYGPPPAKEEPPTESRGERVVSPGYTAPPEVPEPPKLSAEGPPKLSGEEQPKEP
ncbi:MAG: hypothetical protein GQ558_00295 [Thermoplasmata archaeon]|nr:hypothetical protein [Thermoplasmata archaeon]